MITSASSSDQRCYTSTSLINREKFPRRTKPQDPHNIAKAERAQWVSTPHTNRSTTSIQMDADLQKTGRKIMGPRNWKAGAGPLIPKEITTIPEVATRAGSEAEARFKTDLSIACTTRETHTT
jgi:hypothetical protein